MAKAVPITIDVNGCARCRGAGHPNLTFLPLTRPFELSVDGVEIIFSHWAPCPTNGEPILLTWLDSAEDVLPENIV